MHGGIRILTVPTLPVATACDAIRRRRNAARITVHTGTASSVPPVARPPAAS